MIRSIIVTLLGVALRIYFRRIEVVGLEHVPATTPVIFVLNHPNALVDPVFLLCLAPRRVSFLAKAPLFRMPVIGFLVRAMESLPVYRRQDEGEDVSKNEETFVAARKLLARGATIGICPEGVSHDAPGLKPIKTGAARLSLAAVSTGEVSNLQIIPAGLYYTSKTSFRSSALLYFGERIAVEPTQLEPDGSVPREAARQLSSSIEAALRAVILDAQHEEQLHVIARAERIFSSDATEQDDNELASELLLQQRFAKAYPALLASQPERLRRLEKRMIQFEEELNQSGVDAEELSAPRSTFEVFIHIAYRSMLFVLMLGPAAVGTIVHYPAYRLGGSLSKRLARDSEDMVSTIKIFSAMLLFPLTWLLGAVVMYLVLGVFWAVGVAIVFPFTGWVAMIFFEELEKSLGSLRVLSFFIFRRRFFVRLLAERKAIKNEILALGEDQSARPEPVPR